MAAILNLPSSSKERIWSHLLSKEAEGEAAGFAFATHSPANGRDVFDFLEWHPVSRDGFAVQTDYHIELTDDVRATVVKRAHDLEAAVIEFHTHLGPWPAAFSASDERGLAEFVPHVRWRLKGRPYIAVVVTERDFDGLVWIGEAARPRRLDGIVVDDNQLVPTGHSALDFIDG